MRVTLPLRRDGTAVPDLLFRHILLKLLQVVLVRAHLTKGAQRLGLCRSFAHMTVGLGMAVMAVMGAVMYIFAPDMMSILTPVEEIRALGIQSLRIEAFAEPMFAASIVVYCVCVGAGDTLKPALINLFSMWCVRLSLAALLAPEYGLKGVWTAMALELTFRGILFLVRLFRGKWLHHKI